MKAKGENIVSLEGLTGAAMSAAGSTGAKAGGSMLFTWLATIIGLFLLVGTAIVMAMTRPQSHREAVVAFLSTFMFAVGGGSIVIIKFGMLSWFVPGMSQIELIMVCSAIGGIFCACGMPGFIIIRAAFMWAERNKDKWFSDLISALKQKYLK